MRFLDIEKLRAISSSEFHEVKPYPFISTFGLLTDEGYSTLLENLPDVSALVPSFGKQRSHGQTSHDRYVLEYNPALNSVADVWHEFVSELHGPDYTAFIQRMYQQRLFRLSIHWHYAPRGSSVSPHCDALHKLGSHIFYLNDADTWDPDWGGNTLILDDNGRFDQNSSPDFDSFDNIIESECAGNYSTLFARKDRSWHGVREINCPEDQMRKVFIIVVNRPLLYAGRQMLKWLKLKK
jgi:hypothetical protein